MPFFFVIIYTSFTLVCINILSEFCLRKDEGSLLDAFLTNVVFKQMFIGLL